jgi:hypothetical protein
MILDGVNLSIGGRVYHLTLGFGTVSMVTSSSAMALFNGQQIGFDAQGKSTNAGAVQVKMIGVGIPLQVWPEGAEDVTKLIPIINEAVVLMRLPNV